MRLLLVERAALRRDQVPAAQVGRAGARRVEAIGRGDLVDEIVVDDVGDPDLLEMRGHAIAREAEAHEVEEALLLRLALDAGNASPSGGRSA